MKKKCWGVSFVFLCCIPINVFSSHSNPWKQKQKNDRKKPLNLKRHFNPPNLPEKSTYVEKYLSTEYGSWRKKKKRKRSKKNKKRKKYRKVSLAKLLKE